MKVSSHDCKIPPDSLGELTTTFRMMFKKIDGVAKIHHFFLRVPPPFSEEAMRLFPLFETLVVMRSLCQVLHTSHKNHQAIMLRLVYFHALSLTNKEFETMTSGQRNNTFQKRASVSRCA